MGDGPTMDRRRQARAKKAEKVAALQIKEDMAVVLATPAGRRFMYRLIYDTCGLQDLYVAQDSGIYKHEGKRSVGVALARDLQTDHTDAYILMIQERMQDLKLISDRREPEPEEAPEENQE